MNPATSHTILANEAFNKTLPHHFVSDIEDAKHGFIGTFEPLEIKSGERIVWSMKAFDFLKGQAPPSVNPSLWRQAKLNCHHGLFKVCDRVYQIRGFDIANITIVEGNTGLIVIDTLMCVETAKAAMQLYFTHRPQVPVHTIVYTHSHGDHFGGVKGIVNEEDVKASKVAIIAPDFFMDYCVSENVIAGVAMGRRAQYQFGHFLPKNEFALVDSGLGKTLATGTISLIPPTMLIKQPREKHIIDGIEIEFMLTPHTEAPSEMNLFFPQLKMLNIAENASRVLHNFYALRGAEVRDSLAWSKYINEALRDYAPHIEVLTAQHHHPTFGKARTSAFLKKQRDIYKFIHDQSVRLLNHGYKPAEIAEKLKLPPSLEDDFGLRGYYGTVSHNAKAVYQKYLGWYDANPANLNPLPPVESAVRYIDYMGGEAAVLAKAQQDYDKGDYRWVAEIASKLVFANPKNLEARELAAASLEQLGYQAESGIWRNAYLYGAQELRKGLVKMGAGGMMNPSTLSAIPIDLFFNFLGVKLNPEKALGKHLVFNWHFTDLELKTVLNLENSTLTHYKGVDEQANASFTLTRETFDKIILKEIGMPMAILKGQVKIKGNPLKLAEFFGLLDDFNPAFNIIEPLA